MLARKNIKLHNLSSYKEIEVEKLVIIGSGPAGLTAGIYAARADLNPIIIDGEKPGGQLMGTTAVENWPGEKSILGPTLMLNMREHAKHLGCRFMTEKITNINTLKKPFVLTTQKNKKIEAHAIIVATGASPKKIGSPGEDQYWGKGVTTCAICDGAFYKDKKVIILGGGDTAMEHASFLNKFTKDVTIVHIGNKLSASAPMQKRVLDKPDIKIIYNNTITEFRGNQDHLKEVEITHQQTNEKKKLPTDGVFISIGLKPNTDFLKGKVDLSDYGYVKIKGHKEHTKTSVDGIFAAGDVCDPFYRQAITSSAMGCMASLDAERYLAEIAD